jgi:hypothetical protein
MGWMITIFFNLFLSWKITEKISNIYFILFSSFSFYTITHFNLLLFMCPFPQSEFSSSVIGLNSPISYWFRRYLRILCHKNPSHLLARDFFLDGTGTQDGGNNDFTAFLNSVAFNAFGRLERIRNGKDKIQKRKICSAILDCSGIKIFYYLIFLKSIVSKVFDSFE